MRQELTLLLDSFRLLQAKKLFWVALGISGLVGLIYASIGFTETGMSMWFGLQTIDNPYIRAGTAEAEAFYLLLFSDLIVRFWLAWFAVALALISTSSIFPEFLREGAVEMLLSKPVGRLRLFIWKYLGSLLFVAVQVLLLTVFVFIAIGLRLGEWNFSVFWAVPLVTFVFSLVYCVAVLIGVVSRSTLFALLGAGVFWAGTLLVQWTEDALYKFAYMMPSMGISVDVQTGEVIESEPDDGGGAIGGAHKTVKAIAGPLPKTRECTVYLKRMIRFEKRDSPLAGMDMSMLLSGDLPDSERQEMGEVMEAYEKRHGTLYVLGTSFACEGVAAGIAVRRSSRRDLSFSANTIAVRAGV